MYVLLVQSEAAEKEDHQEHEPGNDVGHHQGPPDGSQQPEHRHRQLHHALACLSLTDAFQNLAGSFKDALLSFLSWLA